MNWTQLSILLGIFATVGGLLWRAGSTWTKKAIALGERAEAEKSKEKEIIELRKSHDKFMERVAGIEKELSGVASKLEVLSARVDERERNRRDTQGIPLRRDEQ